MSSESSRLLSINDGLPQGKGGASGASDGTAFLPAVFNLANAAVGAGILAFPYAFSKAGWLLGGTLHVRPLAASCSLFGTSPLRPL